MSADPLAEALARAYYEPLGWDMDDLDPDDLRDCLRAMEPVADAARAHAAAHDAQGRADERQKVEAEVRELRAELEHPALGLSAWRAVAAQRLVRAEKAEAELARIRALLADEATVEKVAEALHLADWRLDPDGDLALDLAHAALDALAGLIGGEQ